MYRYFSCILVYILSKDMSNIFHVLIFLGSEHKYKTSNNI